MSWITSHLFLYFPPSCCNRVPSFQLPGSYNPSFIYTLSPPWLSWDLRRLNVPLNLMTCPHILAFKNRWSACWTAIHQASFLLLWRCGMLESFLCLSRDETWSDPFFAHLFDNLYPMIAASISFESTATEDDAFMISIALILPIFLYIDVLGILDTPRISSRRDKYVIQGTGKRHWTLNGLW